MIAMQKSIKLKQIKNLASVVIIIVLFSGCGVERRAVDDLSIVFGLGIDIDQEDSRVLEITTHSPTQEEAAEEPVAQTTIKSYGVDGFIRNWQYERHRRLALGKIQVMVFGARVVRSNFPIVLQEFREIPEIDLNSRVVFFDGNPQHLFQVEVLEERRFAIYLREVIERNVEAAVIPDVNLHSLSTDLFTRGKTAYLPYVEQNVEGNRVRIKGLALLDHEGKLATQLNDLETIYLMLLSERRIGAILDNDVILPGGEEATVLFEIAQNRLDIHTQIVNGKPQINIKVRGNAELRELSARNVEIVDEETFNKLDEHLSKHLTVSAQKLIDKLQLNDVDPLGLGEIVRVRHKEYFRNNSWEDDYPHIKITNDVKVSVKRGAGFKRTH